MAAQTSLQETHKQLILPSPSSPLTVQTRPLPPLPPPPGSALIRIEVATILPYHRAIYSGERPYPLPPTPFVTGISAIGRIAALGPDATLLHEGDLVHVDCFLRPRDSPDGAGVSLWGIFAGITAASQTLMRGLWRDGPCAQFALASLEQCYRLDEAQLLGSPGAGPGGFGYAIEDLAFIARMLVPYGGLNDMDIRPGETVVVAPATGSFGGAAVHVAVAMGARVVAAGRNAEALARIEGVFGAGGSVCTARLTGTDAEADAAALKSAAPKGVVDAYLDFMPPSAAGCTYVKSGLLALRRGGRACLMGGLGEDVAVPYRHLFANDLKLMGRWMYDREGPAEVIRLVESGRLRLGEGAGLKTVGKFGLEEWDQAYKAAEDETPGLQTQAVFVP